MNKVKSISLDDMDLDELPNPIGGMPDDSTKNKDMLYSPQYGENGAHSNMGLGADFDDGTVKRGSRFQLPANLTRFTQLFGGKKLAGGDTRKTVLAGVLGCLVIASCLYFYLGDTYINDLLGEGGGTSEEGSEISEGGEMASPMEDNVATPVPDAEANKTDSQAGIEVTTPPMEEMTTETKAAEEIPGNPYWKLPNPAPALSDATTAISTQQSDSWRAGLNHPFSYQRYKATQEMRKSKVDGSVSILYEALAQPKFWTRMEALIGIAENGVAIDTESMRTAIGEARPDLVRNYFKRFRKDYTDATAHIMRQAMRVVDGKARAIILFNLAAHRSEINDQYLYAAFVNETDSLAKDLIGNILAQYPIPAAHKAAYEKSMASTSVVEQVTKKPKTSEDIKVDKIPANMNVEEVYFINDDEDTAPEAAPEPVEVKTDDGFNDLQHTDQTVKDSAP